MKSMFVELVGGSLRSDQPDQAGAWYLPEEAKRAADGLRVLAESVGATVRVRPHDLEIRLTEQQRAFRARYPYAVDVLFDRCPGLCPGHTREDIAAGGYQRFSLHLAAGPAPGGMELVSFLWIPGEPVEALLPAPVSPADCNRCRRHREEAAYWAQEARIGRSELRAWHEERAAQEAARAF